MNIYVEPLIEQLGDGNWSVRSAACEALGRIGDNRAIQPLIDRLEDKSSSVRQAACDALRNFGEGRLAKAVIGAMKGEQAAIEELANLASEGDLRAIKRLINRLGDKASYVRIAACEALGRIGDNQALEPLIDRLGDQESFVRRATCEALGKIGDAKAVQPLTDRLRDKDSSVRQAACEALGKIGDAQVVELLIEGVAYGDRHVRRAACDALVSIGLESVQPLIERLGDKDYSIRQAAREVLRKLEEGRLAEAMVGALEGEQASFAVREIIALLDAEMEEEFVCNDGVAKINWLTRGALFDFDRVEIVKASDDDVERFCLQVENDKDNFRNRRYRTMICLVSPQCHLIENTMRILRTTFGEVVVKER
jgi:HEAT repeat protein